MQLLFYAIYFGASVGILAVAWMLLPFVLAVAVGIVAFRAATGKL